MYILGLGVVFITIGYILLYLIWMFGWFYDSFFIWSIVLSVIFLAPWIITLHRIYISHTWKHVDRLPLWKHLIDYIRRDNEIIPIEGERAYPGESFLDVKQLGLIEYLGKDCFYNWGDKKIMWGLENINYSPDPRYFNFTHLLYTIGFSDSEDIKNVLNGTDLELMGKVYLKMQEYDGNHGVNKLIKEIKEYDGKIIKFEAVETVGTKVDNLFKKKVAK